MSRVTRTVQARTDIQAILFDRALDHKLVGLRANPSAYIASGRSFSCYFRYGHGVALVSVHAKDSWFRRAARR